MLNQEDNALFTQVGPGTPMGEMLRRYWQPVQCTEFVTGKPQRLKILGENLVAFRDTDGRVGILERQCPHRLADMWFGRNENNGLTCAYHGWAYDPAGKIVDVKEHDAGKYSQAFDSANHDLEPLPNLASYNGIIFGSLSRNVPPLDEYLGEIRFFLDLVILSTSSGSFGVPLILQGFCGAGLVLLHVLLADAAVLGFVARHVPVKQERRG